MKTNRAVWKAKEIPELHENMVVTLFHPTSGNDYLITEPDKRGRSWQCIQNSNTAGGMYKYPAGNISDINAVYDSLYDWKRNTPLWVKNNNIPQIRAGMVIVRGTSQNLYLIANDNGGCLKEMRLADNTIFDYAPALVGEIRAVWDSYTNYILDQTN